MTLKLTTDVRGEASAGTLFALSEVADVLGVAPERVRAWVTAGLIQPVQRDDGWQFEFRQVAAARTICDLARSGLGLSRLRRQLERLKAMTPDDERPLDCLALVEQNGRLLIRLDDGDVAASDGQLHFDFSEHAAAPPMRMTVTPATAAEWHELGIDQEQQGHLEAAAESYRLALQVGGPDAQVCFDLAHVLAAAGQHQAAIERYLQAVELNRDFAGAWNNLGVLLAEMKRPHAACTAFRRALAAEPFNLRAHYNLADTLDEMGRADEARAHWQAFLRGDDPSACAAYARSKLA